jgi:hypothetical protein
MNSALTKPLFQALIRIEKKLDEVLRAQEMSRGPAQPSFHLTQGLSQPGQNPCGLCGKMPTYRKISVPSPDGMVDVVTIRFCECEPHTEDI